MKFVKDKHLREMLYSKTNKREVSRTIIYVLSNGGKSMSSFIKGKNMKNSKTNKNP